MFVRLFLFFLIMVIIGCGTEAPISSEQGDEKTETKTQFLMVENVSIIEGMGFVEEADLQNPTLRLRYPDHEVMWTLDVSDSDALMKLERERLEAIRSHFNPDDLMEAPVYASLSDDLRLLEISEGPEVKWIEVIGRREIVSDLVSDVFLFESGVNSSETASLRLPLITDWTNDASYVPAGGTSTISTSGTLQKFWLDQSAKNALNGPTLGLEIDTLVKTKFYASCSTGGASSNMPGYYADTEAFDVSNQRNCSVGTVNANQLQAWTLYWTWHPFGSFSAFMNPHIDVQYQPKSWCSWTLNAAQCNANRPWCMCNYLPTEWLVSYDYGDAQGVEVFWTKN